MQPGGGIEGNENCFNYNNFVVICVIKQRYWVWHNWYFIDGTEFRKKFSTLNDRQGSLRAKPGWFDDLITPYEGFAEGPPRALGDMMKDDGMRTPIEVNWWWFA